MLHGCTVGDGTLIGIRRCCSSGSRVGHATAWSTASASIRGPQYPDGSLILGRPAKAGVRSAPGGSPGLQRAADIYVEKSRRYGSARWRDRRLTAAQLQRQFLVRGSVPVRGMLDAP